MRNVNLLSYENLKKHMVGFILTMRNVNFAIISYKDIEDVGFILTMRNVNNFLFIIILILFLVLY